MRILPVNNLGTIIYTMFYGKEVGKDSLGNTYFVSKKNSSKKWILYEKKIDPTNIPTNWQVWLTSDNLQIQDKEYKDLNKKYSWEKKRKKNYTGTDKAYHPAKELSVLPSSTKKKKYSNWEPN